MSANIAVNFCGVTMATPIIAASGTFGFGLEYAPYLDLDQVGAVSVKGLTREPRRGNVGVRIAETPAGILNCIGLENPGVEAFCTDILPQIHAASSIRVMANISGNTVADYAYMAERLNDEPVDFLEVNISCPNVKKGGMSFGVDPHAAAEVTRAVKDHTRLPVVVKLSPNVTDIRVIASAVEEAGADAVSLVNTFMGLAIDAKTRRPLLGNVTGGLSGPCVKPMALRLVWEVAQTVDIPICGLGGIMTGLDAIEFMMVGAGCVSVGTATMRDPAACVKIADEMAAWCDAEGVKDISEIVGTLRIPGEN